MLLLVDRDGGSGGTGARRGRARVDHAEEPDVLVVGAGISGLSAALEAGRGGATVLAG